MLLFVKFLLLCPGASVLLESVKGFEILTLPLICLWLKFLEGLHKSLGLGLGAGALSKTTIAQGLRGVALAVHTMSYTECPVPFLTLRRHVLVHDVTGSQEKFDQEVGHLPPIRHGLS